MILRLFQHHTLAALCAIAITTLVCSGCVRRRMTVRTSPPGAMVYVDHQSIGTTPVSTNFTYYGTRQFEVIKDGYRTEKFLRRFNPPWYEWPVLDFISESLWPFEKRDERIIDVQLTPELDVPTDALIQSGEDLRSQASKGIAVNTQGGLSTPPPSELVIPRGGIPIVPSPVMVPAPGMTPSPFPPGTIPVAPTAPSFFDASPSSIPATQVTPGQSYRPNPEP